VSITPLRRIRCILGVGRRSASGRFKKQRQNPNPSYYEGFGTPRVSIVQAFTPVPRGRVGHPPPTQISDGARPSAILTVWHY
jgi:hypothetical protein